MPAYTGTACACTQKRHERSEPIPAFRGKTALELVGEGRAEGVAEYVASVSAGFVG